MRILATLAFLLTTVAIARGQVVESWRIGVDHSVWRDFPNDAQFAADGTVTYFGLEQTGPPVGSGAFGPSGASAVRIDTQGNVVWSSRYDGPTTGPHDVRFYAGALDESGGCAGAAQSIPLPGPSGTRDLHVVRYDAAGAQLWARVVPDALPRAITIARDGDVWVAGTVDGSSGYSDVRVWRFGPNGALVSTTTWNGPQNAADQPIAIATDGVGGLYLVGSANGTVSAPAARLLLRFNSAGNVLWSRVDGTAPALATDLVVSSDGVYVASTIAFSSGRIGVLAKYDVGGASIWERYLSGGPSPDYHPSYVGLAPGGDVVGASGSGVVNVRRFDPAGSERWSTTVVTSPGDAARAIDVDANGNTICVGGRGPAASSFAFVAKIDTAGALMWVRTVGGSGGYLRTTSGGVARSGSVFLVALETASSVDSVLVARFDDAIVSFCAGDGHGTACPCSNTGAPGRGCANSVVAAGALLEAHGAPLLANDSLVLHGSGMPNGPVLYFQGTSNQANGTGSAFGDGKLCVGGTIVRLGVKLNASGASMLPEPSDASISTIGAIVGGMQARSYQAWYRNSAPFCTPDGFNLTNALVVIWSP